jgi:hypothetical protein
VWEERGWRGVRERRMRGVVEGRVVRGRGGGLRD